MPECQKLRSLGFLLLIAFGSFDTDLIRRLIREEADLGGIEDSAPDNNFHFFTGQTVTRRRTCLTTVRRRDGRTGRRSGDKSFPGPLAPLPDRRSIPAAYTGGPTSLVQIYWCLSADRAHGG